MTTPQSFIYVGPSAYAREYHDAEEAAKAFLLGWHGSFLLKSAPTTAEIAGQLIDKGFINNSTPLYAEGNPRSSMLIHNTMGWGVETFHNINLSIWPRTLAHLLDIYAAWETFQGPRMGDFIIHPKGHMTRFTARWDDGLQAGGGNGCGFHIGTYGASYSGGLTGTITFDKIVPTMRRRFGQFWFFKDNSAGAHRGVDCVLPCRVYQEVE
jgi:hypothetical protein